MNNKSKNLTLETLDKEIKQLPALSEVVMEVIELIDKGEVEFQVLMKKISQDQSLASRVLKVANSPFYGDACKIGSLKGAGVMLGIHTLRSIVTTVGIIGRFSEQSEGKFDRLEFWKHAIGTGITAKVIAMKTGFDQDTAFSAGLLHDIGKLVLDVHFPEDFAHVLSRRDSDQCLLRDAELKELGFDHALVGAKVAKHWKLPVLIQTAISDHHNPHKQSTTPIVDLIHVSDIICRGMEIGNGGDDLIPKLNSGSLNRLRLNWTVIERCLPEIEKENADANQLIEDIEIQAHVDTESRRIAS